MMVYILLEADMLGSHILIQLEKVHAWNSVQMYRYRWIETVRWCLQNPGICVVGFQMDAFLHSLRNVESKRDFQAVFTCAVVWSWPAFLHSLEQLLDFFRVETIPRSHSEQIPEKHCTAAIFLSHKNKREKNPLSGILLCVEGMISQDCFYQLSFFFPSNLLIHWYRLEGKDFKGGGEKSDSAENTNIWLHFFHLSKLPYLCLIVVCVLFLVGSIYPDL